MGTIRINRTESVTWQPAPANDILNMDDGMLDVWLISARHGDGLLKWLSPSEIERSNRFRNDLSRSQFISTRAALRYLCAKYTGEKPGLIRYGEAMNQKPILAFPECGLHFNIAHSGEYVVISFARSEMGIDAETINRDFLFHDIIERYFTGEEMRAIKNAADPHAQFYLFWTRKEALLKARGTGIGNDLFTVPCTEGDHKQVADDWKLNSIGIHENAIASFAFDRSIETVRYFGLTVF